MNVRVEAEVATAAVQMGTALVRAILQVVKPAVRLISQTTSASILRSLRSGNSSMNAVQGDTNLMIGGLANAA